jgi:dihydroneopterin aldolase
VPHPRDVLSIHGLDLECIVGLHPHERDLPQPLRVDVDLRLDTESAAVSERIGQTVDYDAITAQIVFLLQAGRFELLETAAHVLALHLLSPPAPGERRSQVGSVWLRLEKTAALGGRGIPALAIERDADWARLETTATPFGSIDVIHQARFTRIYRLNLDPGRSITRRSRPESAEAELCLGEGLEQPEPRVYRNSSARSQSLLCVDREVVAGERHDESEGAIRAM